MRERSYRLAAGGVWKENIPVKLERGARVYAEWGYGFSESGTFAIIRQRDNGNLDKEYTTENNFNLEDETTLECVWRDVRKRLNETSY